MSASYECGECYGKCVGSLWQRLNGEVFFRERGKLKQLGKIATMIAVKGAAVSVNITL